ncbi:MAG TPA: class I SAM-dependent methyltransferase [bacterium]|nr:class I SAM-dependent methyltransferase [bacterium]
MERQPELVEGMFADPEKARAYGRRSAARNRRMGRTYAKELARVGYTGGPILDAGCGSGECSIELAKVFPDAEAVGLDLSPELVEMAREKAAKSGPLPNLRFEVGDAAATPHPDGHFDVVICTDVLQIVPDPVALVNELERVLAPGGRLYLGSIKRSWLGHLVPILKISFTIPEVREILQRTRLRPHEIIEKGIYFVVVAPPG